MYPLWLTKLAVEGKVFNRLRAPTACRVPVDSAVFKFVTIQFRSRAFQLKGWCNVMKSDLPQYNLKVHVICHLFAEVSSNAHSWKARIYVPNCTYFDQTAIVSQPSKCLKFMTFRERCFVIRNWMQVLKWSSLDFLSPLVLQKMKEDNISQLGDYVAPFWEQQYTQGSCYISLFKFKSLDSLITPNLSQILDIYSVVAQ